MSAALDLDKLEYTLADVRRVLSLGVKEFRGYIADGRVKVILRKGSTKQQKRRKRIVTRDDLLAFHTWLTTDQVEQCPVAKKTGHTGTTNSKSNVFSFSELSQMRKDGLLPKPSGDGGPKNARP